MSSSRQGVRHLLAVYGGISAAVRDFDRNDFGATVDEFLPGYSAHPDWYSEVDHFLHPTDPGGPPDTEQALIALATEAADDIRLPQPQKARLLLALAVIARVNRLQPDNPLPALCADEHRDLTIEALAAAGPGSSSPGQCRDRARAFFDDEFARAVPESFVTRSAFDDVRAAALRAGAIGEQTATMPLCAAGVVNYRGFDAVVVDTEFSSDSVSLNNLKRVVNPYNWNENYPEFFLRMSHNGPTHSPDGWRRVLETVSFVEGFELTTPLKFNPTAGPTTARLDYDLDISRFDTGDGRVRVDHGYINMTAIGDADDGGVRIRTRKVVHIEGISPYAQQRLVCICGYGTASSDFLLGRADPPYPTAEPFDYPDTDEAVGDIDDTPATRPRHAVPTAVQIWTDTMMGVTGDYAELAGKWWDRGIDAADLTEFGGRVGSRLAAAPLTFLDAMYRSRHRSP